MDILFIHPNFPGQFLRIAEALGQNPQYRVYGMGDVTLYTQKLENVELITYDAPEPLGEEVHRYNRPMESAVRRAESGCKTLLEHKRRGFEPDIIFIHPGWGDAFFLKEIFPMTPIVGFFEYFYRPRGADLGFDPEFPMRVDDIFRLKTLNALHLLSLESCDIRITPTQWQRSLLPEAYRESVDVLHEGVDTDLFQPDPDASITLDGVTYTHGEEVLTFVSRNLEPYRGYHQFMRSLPKILEARPECRVIIVGAHEVSYGSKLPEGESYYQRYWDEVKDRIDTSRVLFTGALAYNEYRKVLQISRAHVYLTYPFVLSWSALEALSCGCVVIGSDTPPVREVITDGVNGILTPFFDPDILADRVIDLLTHPEKYRLMGENAREYVIEHFDFRRVSLPKYEHIIQTITL